MDHHLARLAHGRHQDEVTKGVAAIEELRRRQRAIPREVAALDAANRRDRTEIDSLGRGLGSLRNHRQIRTMQGRVDDRARQRATLIAEHRGLQPQIAAAERAHAAVVDRGPDSAADQLDNLERRLEADLTTRLDAATPEEYLELERRFGPRSNEIEFGDAWDQVAGARLQHRAVQQLVGHVPQEAAELAGQLTHARLDQASRHFDNQRLLHRLKSLERPHLERGLGIEGPGLSL
jgi:chromosome segregation ATPase